MGGDILRQLDDNLIEGEPYTLLSQKEKTTKWRAKFFITGNQGNQFQKTRQD